MSDKPQILVVEDDEIAGAFLYDILTEAGYTVDVAGNGQIALGLLETKTPDLIISDVLMPELNGLDLFARVQTIDHLQSVPFIFLTCLDEGDAVVRIEELGPDDYLVKPVRPRHLLARVRGKLHRKQLREEQMERGQDLVRDRIHLTLSHELRTPLTVIQGISDILLNDRSLPEAKDYQELLQSLRSRSFELGSLVERFLLASQIDGGVEEANWRSCATAQPLAEVVTEAAMPWLQKSEGDPGTLECRIPVDLPCVHVYRPHAVEIVRELLSNAFKFADARSPRVVLSVDCGPVAARVTVADNGMGIPPERHGELFDKMAQLDREKQEQQGSGLGLYIVKRLLEINRGSIAVREGNLGGAEFEVILPFAP